VTLLLLWARRRAKANAGHAEFPATEASGFGRVTIPAHIAAAFLPHRIAIRGTGGAEFPVTDADGVGRIYEDEDLLRLLLSAA
jgi:hypothetical protein